MSSVDNPSIFLPIKNFSENVFAGLNKLTGTIEGIGKLSSVVSPIFALYSLCTDQEAPLWLEKLQTDLSAPQVIKNGFGWSKSIQELHSKKWNEGFLGTVKRVISIAVSFLFGCEYINLLVKNLGLEVITTVAGMSVKVMLLEVLSLLNVISGCFKWHEISQEKSKLKKKIALITEENKPQNLKKQINRVKRRGAALRQEMKEKGVQPISKSQYRDLIKLRKVLQGELVTSGLKLHEWNKKNKIEKFKQQLQEHEVLAKKFEEAAKKIENQAKLHQINGILSFKATSYLSLKQKSQMLKLVANLTDENKKDLAALKEMDTKLYKLYKIQQYRGREGNLSTQDTKNKFDIVCNLVKMVVFGLGLGKAYFGIEVMAKAVSLDEKIVKIGMEGIKLLSGLLGLGGLVLDQSSEIPEIRPSAYAA